LKSLPITTDQPAVPQCWSRDAINSADWIPILRFRKCGFGNADLKINLCAGTLADATKTSGAKITFVFRFYFQPGFP
jgi:hypothetical protein